MPNSNKAKSKYSKEGGGNGAAKEIIEVKGATKKIGGGIKKGHEHSKKGETGHELEKTTDEEEKGKKTEYSDEKLEGNDHHKSKEGAQSFKFHEGSHHDKGTYEKVGFSCYLILKLLRSSY